MRNIIPQYSLFYLNNKYIANKYFPLLGLLFLFNTFQDNLFLSFVNFLFVLLPITRKPDIESKSDLIKERIILFVISLLNFICPVFIPYCLQKISNFPPEDWGYSYSQTNKQYLYFHERVSFNILYHCSMFSFCSLFLECLIPSLIFALFINEYLVSGIYKLMIGYKWYDWILHEKVGYLHYWSKKYGWANFISDNFSLKICRILNANNILLNLGCLIFEIGGLIFIAFIFTKNIWCYGTILFHTTVFICTGILFWQNMMLLYCLTFIDNYSLILTLALCFLLLDGTKTRPLGWFSINFCEIIELIGVLEDGTEKVLANDVFGARERTLGIRYGRVAIDGNFRTWHIGETSLQTKLDIDKQSLQDLKNYKYQFRTNSKWLKYLKNFIKYSHNHKNWIWEKIVPEGQIFYTQKDRYRFEQPLKSIKLVFKVWYLDKDYTEHLLEERILRIVTI